MSRTVRQYILAIIIILIISKLINDEILTQKQKSVRDGFSCIIIQNYQLGFYTYSSKLCV